jgi:hypothetical protein
MTEIQQNTNTSKYGITTDVLNNQPSIAEIAYYKSESRGFEPGYELHDWLEAEREYYKVS